MFTKRLLVSALFAAGALGAVATPLTSVAQVVVYLNTAPPPVRIEAVPAPRTGYMWSNGHWQHDGSQYVWSSGDWQAARPGYTYVQPTWVESNGRYAYAPPRWDRDGDGVPNRRDAAPDNPRRN